MPLLDLMRTAPSTVAKFTIEQAVRMAGDGNVLDGSECSVELRHYLSSVTSEILFNHANHCLSSSFDNSGFVLQDIVNELGRRLGYQVEYGLYRGKRNANNFDGLWKEPAGSQVVVEVKTSDTYRINLDTVANYRRGLISDSIISDESSILLVVGRQDTGDLEAQIRGSKHAWDVRIISTESLVSLVRIKEGADEDATLAKIRSLLAPIEYTRLDNIIDVMFTATQDVEEALEFDSPVTGPESDVVEPQERTKRRTPSSIIDRIRKRIVSSLAQREGINLIAYKRAQFWTPDRSIRVACAVSKRYKARQNYWYAYHGTWHEFINAGDVGYFAIGCVDRDVAYVLPRSIICEQLPKLGTTNRDDRKSYWHVRVAEDSEGAMSLVLRGDAAGLPLAEFEIELQ